MQQLLQPQPPEPLQLVLPLLPVVLPPRERRQEPELPAAMPPAARAVPLQEAQARVAEARVVQVRAALAAQAITRVARLLTSMPSTKNLKTFVVHAVTPLEFGVVVG